MNRTFTPLAPTEREKLWQALRYNASEGAALLTHRRDTSFAGTAEQVPDEEVITAIRSVPCHYARDTTTMPSSGRAPLVVAVVAGRHS